jgi:hypothetical protein
MGIPVDLRKTDYGQVGEREGIGVEPRDGAQDPPAGGDFAEAQAQGEEAS